MGKWDGIATGWSEREPCGGGGFRKTNAPYQ
jgi:hypothetical protein